MEALVTMSNKELDRLKVVHSVINNKLTWQEAASQLDLSNRQIGRLVLRVRKEGNKGIIHRLRGKPSNHQLPPGLAEHAAAIVKEYYDDFGPTFANEKLLERHKIDISVSTLRTAMIGADIWHPRRSKPKHRAWRERR